MGVCPRRLKPMPILACRLEGAHTGARRRLLERWQQRQGLCFPFLKKILTEKNHSRKECLLLPFETLKKVLKSDYGKN